MPSALTYPGVYVEEVPSGVRTITGVATSITAFVGYTAKGPVNRAVRLFNYGDYEREFGGLHRDSDVSYAVQQFFMNGGGDAYVVRVARDVTTASIELRDSGGAAALVVEAASPGAWGNALRVQVDYDTASPDSLFNLVARRVDAVTGATLEVEEHRNLSMNSRAPGYAPDAVRAASRLVRVKRAAGLAFAAGDRGYSLSGRLQNVALDPAANSVVRGVLNGTREFELVITGGVIANGTAAVVRNRLEDAITAAGLDRALEAVRADGNGTDNAGGGNYVKLRSLLDPADAPGSVSEFSSVRILPAAVNDASVLLRLGEAAGGREREGASYRRPVASGTVGAPVPDLRGTTVNQAFTLQIVDNTDAGAVDLLPATAPIALSGAQEVGPALVAELTARIHAIDNAAAKSVRVDFTGGALRLSLPAHDFPNAHVVLGGALAGALRMPAAAGAENNLAAYRVGVRRTARAQGTAVTGLDGSLPNPAEYLGSPADKTGVHALRDVDLFNLLVLPGVHRLTPATAARQVLQSAVALCEEERAFAIVDPPPDATLATVETWAADLTKSRNAAVYFPWVQAADPLLDFRLRDMPPSGAVAGVYARTDAQRGVWKAPAGTDAVLTGTQALAAAITDPENGVLNPKGVNALRLFPVYGRVVWGARTRAGADEQGDEYKYVPVRRLALYIEETLYRATQWVVFEPNDEPLWSQIRLNVGAFMNGLFRQGAFQGTTPAQAYLVKCDAETTTQYDVDRGIVNILVAFAPLKPAEFVVIRIQQKAQIPA